MLLVKYLYEIYYPSEKVEAVFIPARERTIPFDKTLLDIVAKAELSESKSPSNFEQILLEKSVP